MPSHVPVTEPEEAVADHDFRVSLENFDGPFDLLLRLISKREMDITEVALSAVTSEFITYVGDIDSEEGLDRASQFLVVAATLLDMKVVGLLPQGEYVDAEDVKVLEARDLLFARLLEYRAFKDVSAWFSDRLDEEAKRHPRAVALDEHYRDQAPALQWSTSLQDFQALAMLAFAEGPSDGVHRASSRTVGERAGAGHSGAEHSARRGNQLPQSDCGCS